MRSPPSRLPVLVFLFAFYAFPTEVVQFIVFADRLYDVRRLAVASLATVNFVRWDRH
jgi:hypothetical protein